jgi:predicted alpha-1,2-mannosidase
VADYCDILFMPFTGGARLEPEEYAAPFKKSREKAEAGYYSVFLERDRILCEMTATERVGVHKYSFPLSQEKGSLVIDLRHRDEVLESQLTVVNDREIAGYRISKSWAQEQRVYFVARFNKPFSSSIVLDMAKNPREAAPTVNSKAIVGLLTFYNEQTPLVVTVGISGTSIEGARRNLDAECPGFDFEKIKAATQEKWRAQLSKIEVEGGTKDQKTTFYTALYHAMIAPNLWNDVDGSYRGRDNQVHPNPGHDVYTVFSLWDTHRALHPLLTILEPKRTNDFVQTFLRQYEQSGRLPVWELAANETECMIGNHSIAVIADAYAKGIRDFSMPLALEAMGKTAMQNRADLKSFHEKGFVESDISSESVSKTLEYAYDEWCIAQMSKTAGAGSTDLYRDHIRRAQYYKNVFDPSTRFFRAKNNAAWYTPFDPYEVNFNYTEANAWQYRFSVQQDVSGLIRLMGGPEQFENQLDSLFTTTSRTTGRNQADITGMIGQYVQGNEPSHHIAYLYNYVGKPWKTQQRIRQIMDGQYAARPDGLSGNEDCGQMSAWFVLSAMGFYPVQPGSDTYVIGTPLFDKVTLHLENGNKFIVHSPGTSAQKRFIKSASFNEKAYPKSWFSHTDLTAGGRLTFEMSDVPSDWGAGVSERPVSEITGNLIVPVPFIAEGKRTFRDRQLIKLGSIDPEAKIVYTVSNSHSVGNTYSEPIEIHASRNILFYAEKNMIHSLDQDAYFYKIPDNLRIFRYNIPFSTQYTGGGDEALIDGLVGEDDFRTGNWQGFEGTNLDVVFDLGKKQKINKLKARFLQDENAWVFFPAKVQVEVSSDGKNFSPAGEVLSLSAPTEKGVLHQDFELVFPGLKTRYVRVIGVATGQCPTWHKGSGNPCWIFSNEIRIE